MVRYTVMWKFKPTEGKTSKEIAEDVKDNYEALKGKIPGLIDIEVGVNRNDSATAFDAVMTADFESWKALADYKADSLRDNIIKYVETLAEQRVRVEYER